MRIRLLSVAVTLTGILTAGALALGLGTIGGLMALVQLGGLVGAPVALVLHRSVRSRPVSIMVSGALSLALSALAGQSLVWFGFASPETVVLAATVYGLCLAWILDAGGRNPSALPPKPVRPMRSARP